MKIEDLGFGNHMMDRLDAPMGAYGTPSNHLTLSHGRCSYSTTKPFSGTRILAVIVPNESDMCRYLGIWLSGSDNSIFALDPEGLNTNLSYTQIPILWPKMSLGDLAASCKLGDLAAPCQKKDSKNLDSSSPERYGLRDLARPTSLGDNQ